MQKCPVCGMWFKNLHALHIHMAKHNIKKKLGGKNMLFKVIGLISVIVGIVGMIKSYGCYISPTFVGFMALFIIGVLLVAW